MKKAPFLGLIIFLFSICFATSKEANQQEMKYSAFVYPDSTGQSVLVQDIKLDFRFGGIGIYMPDKYPTIKYVPLETGEQIQFPYLLEVLFKGKRVEWKQFVEPDRRDEYDNIDEKGYRHWSEVEVQTTVIDLQRRKIQSRRGHRYGDPYGRLRGRSG